MDREHIFGLNAAEAAAFISAWALSDARARFREAAAMGAEGWFGGPDAQTSELEMVEEATQLVKKGSMNKPAGGIGK